ncbi:hypothetical protein UPYG_G00217960 [Umbra pygmaea]|uniref:Uncharacterized protein n=1 Tax=Umbra pygmaea TaxID=75934 RepID=A0ABD0WQX7_UMBPY
MRRFFRPQSLRDEDGSQIQYLTAKCNRLTHEKAVLEREFLVAKERERSLKNELDALSTRLCQQEQLNVEMTAKHDQLRNRVHREQDIALFLQQRIHDVEGVSSRDAALLGLQLEQINSELLHLQSSDVKLEGLVDELQAEALQRDALTKELQAQLHSKICELEELQCSYKTTIQKLEELHEMHQKKVKELHQENEELRSANQREVLDLQRENEELRNAKQRKVQDLHCKNMGSLRKLQETAEQFEWLCEQQRYWMCCVKRFKDCLSEEKQALVQQVTQLEKEVVELRKNSQGSEGSTQMGFLLADTESQHCESIPSWESDEMAGLQTQVDRCREHYQEIFSHFPSQQGVRALDGHQKPP